ncbi:hypothetical protein IB238_19590 [Rhizobium sp. ARZ01]|uniref:hypothetical protein n=1 Tax=Rhizobium sp. ARZ01 TaxID=2769313 RepID=UPI0017825034|nr:hypothetical protein [Rhizobium sp. ARZ01]MBD9374834.1 hypothetical protein [Rhizobium sp. ARZ01]
MVFRTHIATWVLSGLLASTAVAAECKQERAIYTDRDGAYELAFEPVGSAAAAVTHRFKVKALKGDLLLDGNIMMGDEVVRSIGMVMHNCPEGDVTGEEIAACTVWQGVMYPLDQAGTPSELVPAEGAGAADRLLLAGFGPALRFSNAWEEKKLSVAPWDVLTYKGCAQ